MPVIIENHSPHQMMDHEKHQYRLKVNDEHIAWFRHRRDEGLAECLRRAADAVDKEERT